VTGRDFWAVAIVVVLGCLLLVVVINKRPQVAVVGLQMGMALCWVCVGLTLAQGLWLNAASSAVGAVAFGAASAEVRRERP
jgi:CHASE2 domain-containing sensor protein